MMNSIGLMGAAGSGKDTTARILIQKLQDAGFETFDTYSFARPLKEFTVDVFSISPSIIEPTTPEARALREKVEYVTYTDDDLRSAFDDALSDILGRYIEAHGITFAQCFEVLEYFSNLAAFDGLYKKYLEVLSGEMYTPNAFMRILHKLLEEEPMVRFKTSPRRLLQVTGTEFFRDVISQSFWTDVAPKRGVIYTDVRFSNELDFVHQNGGLILKVVNKNQQVIKSSSHSSEELVYTAQADYVIEHDGKHLETIHQAVDRFIATLN